MAIDMVDTVRLAKSRLHKRKRLKERHEELTQRWTEESAALWKERQTLYDEAFVPFHDVLQRLKHVDPVELPAIENPTVHGETGIVLPRPRRSAVPAAVAALAGGAVLGVVGHLVVGHAVETGTLRVARTFCTASTGRAIRTLHGAAARSAALARLAGGSKAAGGGGIVGGMKVLSEIQTTSTGLWLQVVVKGQLQALEVGRQHRARDLERWSETLNAVAALHEHSRAVRRVLQDLRAMLVLRLPSFTALVEGCDDFTRYDLRQRAEVAAMMDLAGLAGLVMNCPIAGADGRVSEESARVVDDVRARLRTMGSAS